MFVCCIIGFMNIVGYLEKLDDLGRDLALNEDFRRGASRIFKCFAGALFAGGACSGLSGMPAVAASVPLYLLSSMAANPEAGLNAIQALPDFLENYYPHFTS